MTLVSFRANSREHVAAYPNAMSRGVLQAASEELGLP